MSPNNHNQSMGKQQDTFSPWTEAFQTSPVHREGHYDHNNPRDDEGQYPTQSALSAIYDPTERE